MREASAAYVKPAYLKVMSADPFPELAGEVLVDTLADVTSG